ncbi:uncharacterized protein LOC143882826 [Tasmannia lanceolata]|uniref:uncharacterized protein LOC143882826 n=1 Tax=Tasmannia lanceolata TaxID=3420 RepID=UPI0040629C3A
MSSLLRIGLKYLTGLSGVYPSLTSEKHSAEFFKISEAKTQENDKGEKNHMKRMRCKQHPREEGGVGVCPFCLSERLLALIAFQAKEAQAAEDRRKSDPPPLVFPRSVSPYVSRRSTGDTCLRPQLFYSTPQIGPTFSREKKTNRFSLFSSLFGSRSEESVRDSPDRRVSSSSWFSNLFPSRRKKKSRLFSMDDEVPDGRKSDRTRDRGMSPASRKGKKEEGNESPIGSGYSSESSIGRRKQTPARRRVPSQHAHNVSNMAFCLSPLVRANPNGNKRQDFGFSGEIRSANRHHLSSACSLRPNRSRKLSDFGRYP